MQAQYVDMFVCLILFVCLSLVIIRLQGAWMCMAFFSQQDMLWDSAGRNGMHISLQKEVKPSYVNHSAFHGDVSARLSRNPSMWVQAQVFAGKSWLGFREYFVRFVSFSFSILWLHSSFSFRVYEYTGVCMLSASMYVSFQFFSIFFMHVPECIGVQSR